VWVKSLIAYVLKLLIAITPFFVVPLVIKEEADHPFLASILGADKTNIKDRAIAFFTVLDLTLLAVYEMAAHFLPQRQAKKVADAFVGTLFDDFGKVISGQGMKLGPDIRINVMFVRRSAFTLFFRRFVWFANRGFDGGHRDNGLFLFVGQGICGRAFLERQTLSVDLRTIDKSKVPVWPCRENFWLLPWQRKCTAHLTAILTIPIFAELHEGPMTSYKRVGVINIDAVSEIGAERLLSNKATGPILQRKGHVTSSSGAPVSAARSSNVLVFWL
jgi:hypothetical protein